MLDESVDLPAGAYIIITLLLLGIETDMIPDYPGHTSGVRGAALQLSSVGARHAGTLDQ